jgi:hypothetical protein
LRYLVAVVWTAPRYSWAANVPLGLDANWPALSSLADALLYSFVGIGIVALALGFASRYLRSAGVQMVVIAAFAVLSAPRWGSAGELFQNSALTFVEFAVIWLLVKNVVQLNFLGYFLLGVLLSLSPAIEALMKQPNLYYRTNGAILLAAVVVLLAVPGVWWRSTARRRQIANTDTVPV